MHWEQFYQDAGSVWGEKPDNALAELTPQLPRGRVLDLGMGEGRNAIFFAVNGFEVKGVDISPAAVAKCLETARMLNITMEAEAADLTTIAIEPGQYALIIATMSLQFVRKSESEAAIARIAQGLMPGGWVYITVFSTEDPWLSRIEPDTPAVEPRTFFLPQRNTHVHFFERDELLIPFKDLRLHEISEGLYYDPGHPGVPQPHYHGILTYIGQRPA